MVIAADERLFTVAEIAKHIGTQEQTIRAWLKAGRIRGLRPGGDKIGWRVRASEFERFLQESER